MTKDKQTLNNRVTKLEQATAEHERRITALEARLTPKPKERASDATLDEILDEFMDGLSELDL